MSQLKGIPSILSGELLKVLADMGHGDILVIADSNFPAHSVAKANNAVLIQMEAQKSILELLQAILRLFPLDTYDCPGAVMDLVDSDKAKGMQEPSNWQQYRDAMQAAEGGRDIELQKIERFAFYEVAKSKCFAIITTSDCTPYGNLLLRKGVLPFQP